jgi:nucleoid-associated protein YgaU
MPVDEGEGRPDRSRKARTYVVKPGDSLSKIAKAVYGDADRWTEILDANKDKVKDPNKIEVGQELRIP